MTESMYVVPNGRVIDPETRKPLPEKGQHVPRNTYWLRRLNDGDVQEAQVSRETGKSGATDVRESTAQPNKKEK